MSAGAVPVDLSTEVPTTVGFVSEVLDNGCKAVTVVLMIPKAQTIPFSFIFYKKLKSELRRIRLVL